MKNFCYVIQTDSGAIEVTQTWISALKTACKLVNVPYSYYVQEQDIEPVTGEKDHAIITKKPFSI